MGSSINQYERKRLDEQDLQPGLRAKRGMVGPIGLNGPDATKTDDEADEANRQRMQAMDELSDRFRKNRGK